MRNFTESDFIYTDGEYLKTAGGETLTLRGTNLGGWLVLEKWMGAFTGADAGMDIIELLENRFGKEKAGELFKSHEDNYITEKDFDIIASLGFNCVRLPFWYKTLETGVDGKYDFSRIDWAVENCRKRGMYVILDCHGLPGFQSIAHHCGKINDCRLYDETAEGEEYRKKSCELWTAVAEHFKGDSVIAGYDLMNEPMCDFDENQDDEAMWKVYDMLYKTVRKTDPDHVIIMEAIWDFDHLPNPSQAGWENVMYELHLYDPTDEAYTEIIKEAKGKGYNVPVYVGEFKPTTPEGHWDYILNMFNENYVSWTTWTYKGHSGFDDTDWFIYGVSSPECKADLKNDSYETILEKWGVCLRTENFHVMGDVEALSKNAEH